ncbi:MAG: rhamnulokinase [Phycisphaerales bacterium]|nr:rhamnulokinase [Phycisphaerales bacterium]
MPERSLQRRRHVAIDVGASSGRVIDVTFDGGGASMKELHRFAHEPSRQVVGEVPRWCWDIDAIVHEITVGLGHVEDGAVSLGIDTWGCDYGLLDAEGALVGPVTAYRDERHLAPCASARDLLGDELIYGTTGIQFQPFNTLYQLAADVVDPGRPLDRAERMLMIPDLIANRLCGSITGERTNASTTQCFDASSNRWATELLDPLGIPRSLMPDIIEPGRSDPLGPLRPDLLRATGLPDTIRLLASATHDTASAVVAAPIASDRDAFISSGTWSLIGVELPDVISTEEARTCNFTNEAGVFGTNRFLKNVAGLWLLQQAQATWSSSGRSRDWATLIAEAEEAPPFMSIIDPDDPVFSSPGDMPERIRASCLRNGEPVPEDDGAVVRCILESLALRYAACLDELESVTGRSIDRLVVVGGGSRNMLLNKLTARITGRTVALGPAEATALGNALVQHAALEGITDLHLLRGLIGTETVIEPSGTFGSDDLCLAARARFGRITDNTIS